MPCAFIVEAARRLEAKGKKLDRSWVLWGLVHVLIFLCLFAVLGQLFYLGSGELERQIALKILDGQVPYRDFVSEYPPLALLSFLMPALFFRTPLAYHLAFAAEMLLFDLLAMVLIAFVASHFKISPRRSLTVYTLLLIAVGPLITMRYDLLPAVLVLAALTSFLIGRTKTAWAVLALGVTAKLYPMIIAPLFVIYHLRNKQNKQLVEGGITFLAVLLVVTLPWLVSDATGFWHSLSYHIERGLHSESTYGTVLLIGQVLGLTQVEGEFSFGSWNLRSPLADSLAGVSPYIAIGLLVVLYSFCAWLLWRRSTARAATKMLEPGAAALMVRFAVLAVIVFLLTIKIFSPQFLIWLLPLLPLISGQQWHTTWLFLVIAGLTQYIYPYHYIEFELGEPYLIAMMAGRNLLLMVMGILILLPTIRGLVEPSSPSLNADNSRSQLFSCP